MTAALERERERARQVRLLGRVEAAREGCCRAALADAEGARRLAVRRRVVADAAAAAAATGRQLSLRALYGALPGSRHAVGIHDVRDTEKALRAAERAAREAAEAARRLEDTADQALREAERALKEAAARRQRRDTLADQLARAHRLAADNLVEAQEAEELADRAAAGVGPR